MHLGLEVGLPDAVAGIFYGLFGISISIATLILGFAADVLGPRNSICISAVIGFISRLGMAYAVLGRSAWLSASFLFILVGPSIALIGPPIPTAIKRYTTEKTNAIAFAINYGVTNVAAFIATPVIDLIRLHVQDDLFLLPPYALLIAFSALLQIPIFFVTLFSIQVREIFFEMGCLTAQRTSTSTRTVAWLRWSAPVLT
jgi:MFS family permease